MITSSVGSMGHALAVSRIALVKPDKARAVENMILNMAQRGQLMERVRACMGVRC
jgi:DNA-binding TFAR19-related protein (PDSD5 family)